jgi:hypothetical protein
VTAPEQALEADQRLGSTGAGANKVPVGQAVDSVPHGQRHLCIAIATQFIQIYNYHSGEVMTMLGHIAADAVASRRSSLQQHSPLVLQATLMLLVPLLPWLVQAKT